MSGLIKNSFSFHLTTMRILGFYPTYKHIKLYKIYAYLVYCLMTIPVPTLATVYLLTEKNVTLAQISDSAFLICQVGCFIAKFVPFWKNHGKIRRNLCMLEAPIFINHTRKQQNIIHECSRINKRNCFLNLLLVVAALISWATTPFVVNKSASRLPIEIWVPYNIEKSKQIFFLTYVFVVIGVANGAIGSGVIDPLIAGLAFHATGQLKILKDNLQYLGQYVDEEMFLVEEQYDDNLNHFQYQCVRAKIMYEKIKFCINHHMTILNYVDNYEDTFSFVVFVQFLASVLVICNACLQLSMVEPFTYTFFAMCFFLITMLTEIFLFSYYGTTLYEESNSLSNAIYMSKWYEYDTKCKAALVVIMERSKRPLIVTAGKILDLSLVTFTTILRRAYSLLAVLKNY